MDHEVVFENSSSAAVNTLLNTIIYLKAVKYLNIRLRQIYQKNLELKIRDAKDWELHTEESIMCTNFHVHVMTFACTLCVQS